MQVQHVVSAIALVAAQKLSLKPSKLMGSGSVWVKVLHPVDVDRQTHIFDVEVSSEHICNYVLLLEKVIFYTSWTLLAGIKNGDSGKITKTFFS